MEWIIFNYMSEELFYAPSNPSANNSNPGYPVRRELLLHYVHRAAKKLRLLLLALGFDSRGGKKQPFRHIIKNNPFHRSNR